MNSTLHSPPPRYLFPKPYADVVQRFRVAGGFLLLVAFAALAHPSPRSLVIGLPLSLAGLLGRAWAAGYLAKDRVLAIHGPYSFIRNPLYAGTLITAFGLVLAARSLALAVVFAAVFFLVYLPAVELEEQHLRELFPVAYPAYAARVPRFVPAFSRPRAEPRNVNFSWALFRRNQEYKAALGWLLALAWLLWRTAPL